MLRNLRLVILNTSLVLALIFALIPQYWPAVEIYSRYGAIACAAIAVCAYFFLDRAGSEIKKENRTSQLENFEGVNDLNLKRSASYWREVVALSEYLDSLQMKLTEHKPLSKRFRTSRFVMEPRPSSAQADEEVTIGSLAFKIEGNEAKVFLPSKKGSHQKVPLSRTPPYLEIKERQRLLN